MISFWKKRNIGVKCFSMTLKFENPKTEESEHLYPFKAGPVYTTLNLFITAPADIIAPNGDKASVGRVMSEKL